MANRPIEIGPVGQRAAANLAFFRGRTKQQDLARRMEEIGRPMTASAISKAEKLDRRIDVDDLMALAIALDIAPNQLLLPPDASGEPVQLTPAVTVTRDRAWRWAAGEWTLFDEEPTFRTDPATGRRTRVLGELSKIEARAPHRFTGGDMDLDDVLAHLKELAEVRRAVRVLEDAGFTRQQVVQALGQLDRLAQLGDSIATLDEDGDDGR